MAINVGSALVYLGGELTGLKDDLAQGEREATSWAKRVGDSTLKLVGGAIVGGVGAAIGAVTTIGAVALNTSGDIDAAVKKASSQLGSLTADHEKLGDTITNVYGNNFGDSIEDVGQAVVDVTQQMDRFGTMSQEQLQRSTEKALALRDAFDIEVNESTAAANTLMEELGLTSDEAFTFIQSGLQNGLNKSGDFLDTINEYSVQFREGEATAAEFFSFLDSGLKAGALGTDKAADVFKEFLLRIQDGSESTSDALETIGLDVNDITDGLNDGSLRVMDVFNMVQRGIKNVEDDTVAFNAGVALMGSQFEDLGATAVENIDPLVLSMQDIGQMTSDINTQYDTWGTFLEGMKRKVQVGIKPLGDVLLSIGNQAMPLVTSGFEWLETKLSSVIGVFDNFVKAIVTAPDEGGVLLDYLQELPAFLQPIAEFLGELAVGLSEGKPLSEAFRDALAGIVSPEAMTKFDEITAAVGGFIEKAQEFISQHSEELKAALVAIGAVLAAAAIGAAIMSIVGAIAALFNPITLIIGVVAALAAAWEGNWFGIRDKTMEVINWLVPFVQDAIAQVKDWWAENGEAIKANIMAVWNGITAFFTSIINWLVPFVQDAIAQVKDWWAENGESIKANIMTIWDAIVAYFEGIIETVKSIFAAFQAAFEGDWRAFGENLREAWESYWTTITDFLGTLWGMIQPKLAEMWSNLKSWWDGIDWAQLGKDVLDGIVDGLSDGVGRIASKLQDIASAAMEAWDGFWGNQSPSKLMRSSTRDDIMGGAVLGVQDSEGVLARAMTGVSEIMAAPILAGAAAQGGSFSSSDQFNFDVRNSQDARLVAHLVNQHRRNQIRRFSNRG